VFRNAMIIMAVIIAGLAVASVLTLTRAAHNKPLHHAFACAMHTAIDQQWHLPATPCQAPASATTEENK
jgi:hypothetical protein